MTLSPAESLSAFASDLLRRLRGRRSGADRHLATIIDTAVDGIVMIDASGHILVFNPACERLFGYRASEVIGQNVRMLMPQAIAARHDGFLARYLQTGEAGIIGKGRVVEGQTRDGRVFPMDLSVGRSEANGRPVFVGMIRDLSARRELERAEALGAARLRAVIDTAVDGVILADATGRILMVNPAVEQLFGYPAASVIGQNVKMLMPADYAAAHDGYLRRYLDTGERQIIGIGREVTGQRADGSTFPMNLSVGEMQQDGTRSFVGIIHDLSEMKAGERKLVQAQKMEAVGQIAGGVSHDFNNLLTVILGNMELLRELVPMSAEAAELLDAVTAAAERGGQLTKRLLAFSRRQTLRPEPVDCNALIEGMELILRRTLSADIAIRVEPGADLPRIEADPAQLEAAILNLAVNARDAMPGGGTLAISTSEITLDEAYRGTNPEILPGDYVLLSVTDSGTGMSREVLERVFEPFFTTKEVGQGSGMGLPMVYGFVKQSRGHVTIYSEPGLGTTVRLYLPVAAGDRPQREAAAPEPAEPAEEQAALIMIVEDDELVRRHILRCLDITGYRTVAYTNGTEALEAITSGIRPDLLLSDMIMPGPLSGWDTAMRVRETLPEVRVLFTSGYTRDTLIERRRMTADMPLLDKPFRIATLRQMVEETLTAPPRPFRGTMADLAN